MELQADDLERDTEPSSEDGKQNRRRNDVSNQPTESDFQRDLEADYRLALATSPPDGAEAIILRSRAWPKAWPAAIRLALHYKAEAARLAEAIAPIVQFAREAVVREEAQGAPDHREAWDASGMTLTLGDCRKLLAALEGTP
jgi:hypothetical protein